MGWRCGLKGESGTKMMFGRSGWNKDWKERVGRRCGLEGGWEDMVWKERVGRGCGLKGVGWDEDVVWEERAGRR